MAQGCGFPHTQAAKRTAPSRQSLKKEFHGRTRLQNPWWMHMRKYEHELVRCKKNADIPENSLVTELEQQSKEYLN